MQVVFTAPLVTALRNGRKHVHSVERASLEAYDVRVDDSKPACADVGYLFTDDVDVVHDALDDGTCHSSIYPVSLLVGSLKAVGVARKEYEGNLAEHHKGVLELWRIFEIDLALLLRLVVIQQAVFHSVGKRNDVGTGFENLL